ncbi:helix-turn-helix domain-containing protein [Haliea sp. E1-2-M8]|uniref:MarR family winged helix-turn-helix transcriptional regulator n=1 Tax=Haliea sp. E1-2-M8 TaxID=3064706 RepID=UPI0027209304|nr:helix-turn-helix domain-containing protein [Haliea sp. E1-2-M8]MDO8861946.1 helix-turn-helix domain-containing protein [Haliea sp. E1-2-M8]
MARRQVAEPARRELQLEGFLPYLVNNLADRISTGLSRIYDGEYGLSIPEWRVLANLAEHGVLNAKQIVSTTGMEKSKVSRAVKNLTARGLILQRRKEEDNRARDLALTAAGLALYGDLVPHALAWEGELLDCLSVSEYRDFMYLLGKLRQRATIMEQEPPE